MTAEKDAALEKTELSFIIPDLRGDIADEIGLILETSEGWINGRLYMDRFSITGNGSFTFTPALSAVEVGEVLPFASTCCRTELSKDALTVATEKDGRIFTGNYYAKDPALTAVVIPISGACELALCARGALDLYTLGFDGRGNAAVTRRGEEDKVLASCPFDVEYGREYTLFARAEKGRLSFALNGSTLLEVCDAALERGMVGFAAEKGEFKVLFANCEFEV